MTTRSELTRPSLERSGGSTRPAEPRSAIFTSWRAALVLAACLIASPLTGKAGATVTPSFDSRINPFGLGDVGRRAAPAMADLDGDLDAFVGCRWGGTMVIEALPVFECPASPDPSCAPFVKGALLVKETSPGKEQLSAQLKGGPALSQRDLGTRAPSEETQYPLCLYDHEDGLVAQLVVDRAGDACGRKPCWKSLGGDPPSGRGGATRTAPRHRTA